MKKEIELLINKKIANYEVGNTVKVKVDENGTPVDRYWRDRLKDSEIDGCVSIVKEKEIQTMESGQEVEEVEMPKTLSNDELKSFLENEISHYENETDQKQFLQTWASENEYGVKISKKKTIENMIDEIIKAVNGFQSLEN